MSEYRDDTNGLRDKDVAPLRMKTLADLFAKQPAGGADKEPTVAALLKAPVTRRAEMSEDSLKSPSYE